MNYKRICKSLIREVRALREAREADYYHDEAWAQYQQERANALASRAEDARLRADRIEREERERRWAREDAMSDYQRALRQDNERAADHALRRLNANL